MRLLPNYFSRAVLLSFALVAAGDIVAAPPAQPVAAVAAQSTVFAKVGDSVITLDEYNAAFSVASRGKFYHGKPPENEVALLQREVGEQMVARILLLREA